MSPWVYIALPLLIGLATAVVAYRFLFTDFRHFVECLRVGSQSRLVTWYRRETGEAGDAIKRAGWMYFWVCHNVIISALLLFAVTFIFKASSTKMPPPIVKPATKG
jgi:hypothetical protein